VVGLVLLVLSLLSAGTAYTREFEEGPASIQQIDALVPGTGAALRGARGTAAAFGAAFAALWLVVVYGPYRRGEAWAWWALLGATLVHTVVTALRVPLVGTRAGVGTAVTLLVLVVIGLALDLSRVTKARS
jgi:hypothetical protein